MVLGMLGAMQPELFRQDIRRLGVIPFVVATLKQREDLARTAIHILQLLCAPALDPHNHHAALLSRLQGVRRLSEVFSPRHQQARGTGRKLRSAPIQRPTDPESLR
ncbi:hypothetical protein ABBQ32_013772 [Trebouxia sp. C0010 RCD-2024]